MNRSHTGLRRIVICLFALAGSAGAARASLESDVQELISAASLGPTTTSIYVRDLSSEEELVEINADALMIPASNMKLVTTAVALDVLGPGFTYFTELRSVEAGDGPPSLWIIGNGDPTFGAPDVLKAHGIEIDQLLGTWVEEVRETGRNEWASVMIDDRVFDDRFTHPNWPADQLSNHWCAGIAGLNFYSNCVEVIPQPADVRGAAPSVRLFPPAAFFETTNRATTGRTDSFWVSRDLDRDVLVFRGSVRHRRSVGVRVAVRDPAYYLGQHVRQALVEAGMVVGEVRRPDVGFDPENYEALHRIETALSVVLEQANRDSDNLASEGLFKTIGWQTTGQPGSWENGAAGVRLALRNRMGPRAAVFQVDDGSGMSRENRVTARLMVELLDSMWNAQDKREAYLATLAVGGETGTLDDRMDDSSLNDVVIRAKSGYLNGVSALSGYLTLPGAAAGTSRTLAFSMLFNGFERPVTNSRLKEVQERVLATLATRIRREIASEVSAAPR
ncbi:MAG: D-alanyl-D-alanine carboxypeptidase/D-alanyl-D-alanine-endopeptidase [Phycisphaeraceae bacterium]